LDTAIENAHNSNCAAEILHDDDAIPEELKNSFAKHHFRIGSFEF
jgi:hypothetical protein